MRNWVSAAVIAGCLSVVPLARAQFPFPSGGGGAGTLPEPVAFPTGGGVEAAPSFPGATTDPAGGAAAPSLSEDSPSAFSEKIFEKEHAWFFDIGTQGYQRDHLPHTVLSIFDPQNLDTGVVPTAGATVAQKLNQIHTPMNFGAGGTLGYLCGCNAFEFTGFYISQYNRSNNLTRAGQIDLPFFNPPLGFEGDNGLWLQADRSNTTFSSTLGDAELNYRYTNGGVKEAELLAGVRYIDLREKLSTYTDDDGLAFPLVNGQPDPTRVATYSIQDQNRLATAQLGFEFAHTFAPWVTLGVGGKTALGANFLEQRTNLVRGDGFVGFSSTKNETVFSQAYEIKAFVDFHILERARIHLGYNAMWIDNVGDVGKNYNFNLQNINSPKSNGNIFFHGPAAELQFLF